MIQSSKFEFVPNSSSCKRFAADAAATTREGRMSLKLATASLVAVAVTSSPAFACMGSTVLVDNFQDPGWGAPDMPLQQGLNKLTPVPPILTISGGSAQLTPLPGAFALADYGGQYVHSADACVDVLSPTVADPTQAAAGIVFGLTDESDFYVFAVEEDGQAAVLQYNGAWLYPVAMRAAPALKAGANVTNTLRVTWNGTSGATYINGQAFATFTLPNFQNTQFGIWCEGDQGADPTISATYQFSNVKLTNVP